MEPRILLSFLFIVATPTSFSARAGGVIVVVFTLEETVAAHVAYRRANSAVLLSKGTTLPNAMTADHHQINVQLAGGRDFVGRPTVADLLWVSPATVETHRTHVLQTLDIHNTD